MACVKFRWISFTCFRHTIELHIPSQWVVVDRVHVWSECKGQSSNGRLERLSVQFARLFWILVFDRMRIENKREIRCENWRFQPFLFYHLGFSLSLKPITGLPLGWMATERSSSHTPMRCLLVDHFLLLFKSSIIRWQNICRKDDDSFRIE